LTPDRLRAVTSAAGASRFEMMTCPLALGAFCIVTLTPVVAVWSSTTVPEDGVVIDDDTYPFVLASEYCADAASAGASEPIAVRVDEPGWAAKTVTNAVNPPDEEAVMVSVSNHTTTPEKLRVIVAPSPKLVPVTVSWTPVWAVPVGGLMEMVGADGPDVGGIAVYCAAPTTAPVRGS